MNPKDRVEAEKIARDPVAALERIRELEETNTRHLSARSCAAEALRKAAAALGGASDGLAVEGFAASAAECDKASKAAQRAADKADAASDSTAIGKPDRSMLALETRAVLAGAYRGGKLGGHDLLTHAAIVAHDGHIITTLCRRVALDSLADSKASDVDAQPSCDRCRINDPRFKEQA